MKEITVTFENGGVFNGSANSFTLNNLITYYFTIDKNYRVQVNANTMAIEMQEYQNTNGAWYGIDIITAVSVQEVQGGGSGGGDVTKEYLEENYYSKVQIDQITERFYNKDETDERYVRKTGDTMTGPLNITNSEGYTAIFQANSWFIINPENAVLLNLFNNNINVYNSGGVYIRQGSTGSSSLIRLTINGLYIFNMQGENIGSFTQENNYANSGLHIFNNGRVVMHTGKPNTTERFLQINGSSFHLYNNVDSGTFRFYGSMIIEDKLTVQGQFNVYDNAFFNAIVSLNGDEGLKIGDTTNYTRITKSGMYVNTNNNLVLRADSSRGIELFNSHAIIVHNDYNVSGKHTAYNWNGINSYNMNAGDEFNLLLNNNTLNVYCYRFLVYGNYAVELRSTNTDTSIHGPQGYISANNTPKATNDQFLSQNFLDALNLFLQRMQDNIRAQSPLYQIVSAISFDKEEFGGGFSSGGGSSRGGGVGRRT